MPTTLRNSRVWTKSEYFAHAKNKLEQKSLKRQLEILERRTKCAQEKKMVEIECVRKELRPLWMTTGHSIEERPKSCSFGKARLKEIYSLPQRAASAFPKVEHSRSMLLDKITKNVNNKDNKIENDGTEVHKEIAADDNKSSKAMADICLSRSEEGGTGSPALELLDTPFSPNKIPLQKEYEPLQDSSHLQLCEKNSSSQDCVVVSNSNEETSTNFSQLSITENEYLSEEIRVKAFKYITPAQISSVFETDELKRQRGLVDRHGTVPKQLIVKRRENSFFPDWTTEHENEQHCDPRENFSSKDKDDIESLSSYSTEVNSDFHERGNAGIYGTITNQTTYNVTPFVFEEKEIFQEDESVVCDKDSHGEKQSVTENDEWKCSVLAKQRKDPQQNVNRQYTMLSLKINQNAGRFHANQIITRGPVEKPKALIEQEFAMPSSSLMFLRNSIKAPLAHNHLKQSINREEHFNQKAEVKERKSLNLKDHKKKCMNRFIRTVEAGMSVDHLIERVTDLRVPVSSRRIQREKEIMMKRNTLPQRSCLEHERMQNIQTKIRSFIELLDRDKCV